MSEEPARKRRRFEGAPSISDAVAPPFIVITASIDCLPDAVLQHCFSFIGKQHYRFVAGVNRRFQEIYSVKHETKRQRGKTPRRPLHVLSFPCTTIVCLGRFTFRH
jgi:hypothetical protein